MENTNDHEQREQEVSEQEGYVPRPRWQVLAARVGLVLFILFVVWQIVNIARGGI